VGHIWVRADHVLRGRVDGDPRAIRLLVVVVLALLVVVELIVLEVVLVVVVVVSGMVK